MRRQLPAPSRPPSSTRLLYAALALICAAAFPADADDDAPPTRFEGIYEWTQGGDRGALSVEFVPRGEGAWEVSFELRLREKPLACKGQATGSLENGPLEGTVDDVRGRRFGFRGAFDAGVFRGEHFRLTPSGRERATGKLSFEWTAAQQRRSSDSAHRRADR